jgi:hypothetical protein
MARCSPTDALEVLAPRNFSTLVRFSPNFTLCSVPYAISSATGNPLHSHIWTVIAENIDTLFNGEYVAFCSLAANGNDHGIPYLTCVFEFLKNLNTREQLSILETYSHKYITSGQHILAQFTCQAVILLTRHFPLSETAPTYADILVTAPHQLLIITT